MRLLLIGLAALLAILASATLLGEASARPAAAAAAPGDAPSPRGSAARRPVRRWYRVSADVTLRRSGDFSFDGLGTDHREMHVVWRLRSRTAVVLFHQCVPQGTPDDLDPKNVAVALGLGRTAFSCAEVKQRLRELRYSAREIAALRLTGDVRFTADGEGSLDRFEQVTDVPEIRKFHSDSGQTEVCPAHEQIGARLLGVPLAIEGRLQTASAARNGVVLTPKLPLPVEIVGGSTRPPCFVAETGEPTSGPGFLFRSGLGNPFRTNLSYGGAMPHPEPVRFKLGRRFGQAFRASSPATTVQPRANGTWTTTSSVELKFSPCPRGGRDVTAC